MDLHLLGNLPDSSSRFHIGPGEGSLDGSPDAMHHGDGVSSFDSEVITVGKMHPGKDYIVYATPQFDTSSTIDSCAGAQISLIKGGTLATGGGGGYTVEGGKTVSTITPGSGSGSFWEAFYINASTGIITSVNTLSESPPLELQGSPGPSKTAALSQRVSNLLALIRQRNNPPKPPVPAMLRRPAITTVLKR